MAKYPKIILKNDRTYTNIFHILGNDFSIFGVINQLVINTHQNNLTVVINSTTTTVMCNNLNIGRTQFGKYIKLLKEKGILHKIGNGTYIFNKAIFELDWDNATTIKSKHD